MYLLPPQAIHDSQVRVSGDVTIHPTAAIAPGVLLYAEAGCRIEIKADVSIGMGTVLQAHGGQITIQSGANLGAGVLMIGRGVIGSNAVIGPASTLFDHSVPAQAVVTPGSVLGDRSRQLALGSPNGSAAASSMVMDDPVVSTYVDPGPPSYQPLNGIPPVSNQPSPDPKSDAKSFVHGQSYVNDLLSTLLPHRNTLNSFPSND